MHFEDFVDDMEDDDYEQWLNTDATPKQRAIAMRIRDELDEDNIPDEPPQQPPKETVINRFKSAFRDLLAFAGR